MVLSLVLLLQGALSGCSAWGEPAPGSTEALRARFPEQVTQVLAAGAGFVATGEGFVGRKREAAGGFRPAGETIEVVLPAKGEEGLHLRGERGFAVTVRELGAAGVGGIEGSAVTYARAGGRSYWTANAGGSAEEWLLLEAEAVSSVAPIAVWEVDGAALRQQGEAVEVVDDSGRARLRVTAPRAYAEGGRRIEARLVASGARLELWVEASGEAVLVDPLWLPADKMIKARYRHTATLLLSGQVLVTGGEDYDSPGEDYLTSAELYDPATDSWLPAGEMNTARMEHTATLLPSGQVLVAGGYGPDGPLASAELFDPATGSWLPAGEISTARMEHTATLLPSGQVLVAGGCGLSGAPVWSAELYDPATRSWLPAAVMSTARVEHTATLLQSGKVLVAGGYSDTGGHCNGTGEAPVESAELYDPATGIWMPAGAMSTARVEHTAMLLSSGQVLVAGGYGPDDLLASAELYDPVIDRWLPAGVMSAPRAGHTATLLPSGQVLVAGGQGRSRLLASAELYDPTTHSWLPAGAMSAANYWHTATLLRSGRVLIAGAGFPELYDPATHSWQSAGAMSAVRVMHTATWLLSRRVLVAGGSGPTGDSLARAELYDPATHSWLPAEPMSTPRRSHTATLLPRGRVLVAGGYGPGGDPLGSAELYD
ncbi:kelch repeat-containing protein, partial [Sorangium cellulosum]|uniref:kelch repeat-containing protein n=1 Tax=Sorangium cellulosum TaxID=56 RepID=UPI0023DD67F3